MMELTITRCGQFIFRANSRTDCFKCVTFVTENSDHVAVITQGFNALYVATGVTPEPGQPPPQLCVRCMDIYALKRKENHKETNTNIDVNVSVVTIVLCKANYFF